MDRIPPGDLLKDTGCFYDRVARIYDRRFAYSARASGIQAFWLNLKCKKGPLLDLGCGTGRMFKPLKKNGFEPYGVDCSLNMISQASARHPGSPLVLADACQGLPFKDRSFDSVISLHASVIHATRWEDLMQMSREVLRVLKPRGRFVVELPHPRSYPDDQASGWQPFQPGVSTRCLERGLQEVRLDKMGGLRTLVRIMELEDISAWLDGFRSLACFEGYSHLPYDPDEGDLMLVWAEK